ncbi:hypothetical protein [Halorussus marinus]|uniref:hypothetical protein n=1 Tax=Halorussus marinus TaxID=2505976 RepID=UPI0010926133|nr:hypothetical protein [Halorussus marinus]
MSGSDTEFADAGSGGGDSGSGFILPSTDDVRAVFRGSFDWSDYSKVGAGGLIAWSVLAEDIAASGIGAFAVGIASAIASVSEANSILLSGVAEFLAALVSEATATTMLTTAFATASAELREAGVVAIVIAIAEVIVLTWMTRTAWEAIRR